MGHARRCIFLTGAPDSDALDWEESGLVSSPSKTTRPHHDHNDRQILTPTSKGARWRAIPLEQHQLHHNTVDENVQNQFLSFRMTDDPAPQAEEEFLNQSTALLDEIHPSQLANAETTALYSTTYSTANSSLANTSFVSGETSRSTPLPEGEALLACQFPRMTDIKDVPSAEAISRIMPQTMTVNVVASIIYISSARTVRLRKRQTDMEIVELVVGDETRAGFSISVWLVPAASQDPQVDDLRESLHSLRSGDIVVVCNIALSTFRNCVYGQTLSKRVARNSTTITLLSECEESRLDDSLSAKVKRVRGWADHFVGKPSIPPNSNFGSALKLNVNQVKNVLPPDTQ